MDKEAETIDLTSLSIAPDVLALISGQTAFEMNALPISAGNGTITVALQEKYNNETVNDLAFLLGKKINVVTVPDEALSEAITRWYNLADAKRRQISVSHSEVKSVREEERLSEGSADGSVIPLANKIISDAISLGASDIHIEPYDKTLRVRFRLDGFLHEMLHPPSNQSKALISRLKIMADLDIAEKRRPQDGRIRVREGDRVIDIRVSSLPTDFGEKLVLRILDKSRLQLNLEALGFEEGDLQVFRKTIRLPYGMILVTGPTGSGKTTTLYAALNAINHPEINITTIEDPIEYNLTGINQTHVRPDIGVSFASALRAILRQDPNVIMVGEIRDGETAEIAIRAALTGHLVFSTLHTNDAPTAITRLIDMGVEPFLVASSVKLIVAQRLVRTLCLHCKAREPQRPEQLEELSLKKNGGKYFAPVGCSRCHTTGYDGRSAVYEMLSIDNGLAESIARGGTASEIRTQSVSRGGKTLRDAALRKASLSITSLDEVIRETTA